MFDFDDDLDDALDALEPTESAAAEPVESASPYAGKDPILICWYSSGLHHDAGVKDYNAFLKAAAVAGIGESMILGFPEFYGFCEPGYEQWNRYMDKLVDEIDSVEEYQGRPLLLVAHSKGACPAMSLATRLGDRVLKLYIVAASAIEIGKPTHWEQMALDNKEGDLGLLKIIYKFQNDNVILKRTTGLPSEDIPKAMAESKWLLTLVELLRLQYQDTVWPDMKSDDPPIKVIRAQIMGFSAELESASECTTKSMSAYAATTTGGYTSIEVQGAKHVDILSSKGFIDVAVKDAFSFVPEMVSDS